MSILSTVLSDEIENMNGDMKCIEMFICESGLKTIMYYGRVWKSLYGCVLGHSSQYGVVIGQSFPCAG